jgi:glutamyl-Q tRNA(Asp) synthetase
LKVAVGLAVRLDTQRVQGERPPRFVDGQHGVVEHDVATDLGDFVLWRVEDFAAYHLAVVVDDAWQGVTDVVRGSDLLDSTPRQILLQQALGLPTPRYAHVALALAANGQKLSKQNLAPVLPVVSPALDMWNALLFLGYSPPLALRGAEPDELLTWALSAPCPHVDG